MAPAQARQGLRRGSVPGLGLFTVTIALVAMTGGYHIHGWGAIDGALTTLGLMSCVAVIEELTFRGALFRVLEEKTGTWGRWLSPDSPSAVCTWSTGTRRSGARWPSPSRQD
ncbi:hypothetical protein [Streptomyces avermitilis]|uniref:hypothetical protein n=1 Tax=Streptomyces avermitilis TaxID=33903 RepID=UPI00381CEDAD